MRARRSIALVPLIALVALLSVTWWRPHPAALADPEPGDSGASAARTRAIRSACALPAEQLRRIAAGVRQDRSGEIQVVAHEPDFLDGGLMHAGPWDYLQEVPVLWYGPGIVAEGGRVSRPVTVADIAPTQAAVLGFHGFHAPDGAVMREALAPGPGRRPPRLLVTLVWDAAGRNVLELL